MNIIVRRIPKRKKLSLTELDVGDIVKIIVIEKANENSSDKT